MYIESVKWVKWLCVYNRRFYMRVTLVLIYTLQAIEIKSYGNKINHFERKSGRNLCIHKYVHMKTFALFLFIKYTSVSNSKQHAFERARWKSCVGSQVYCVLHLSITLYTRKYSPRFIFTPFAVIVSGRIQDWANYNVSYYLSLNTSVSGRILYGAKLFARIEGRKLQWVKIALYTELN